MYLYVCYVVDKGIGTWFLSSGHFGVSNESSCWTSSVMAMVMFVDNYYSWFYITDKIMLNEDSAYMGDECFHTKSAISDT